MIEPHGDIALEKLYVEIQRIQVMLPSLRWFLFGSITTEKRPAGDIDLLVIGDTAAECALVRNELSTICAAFPIELLLMTLSEEAELDFVRGEGAKEITPTH